TEQQKLTPSDAATGDFFGSSVSAFEDTVAVGAYRAFFTTGSAYVFVRSGTIWTEQQKLVGSDVFGGAFFGASVTVAGDTAVVGAPATGTGSATGEAYVFVRSGTIWNEQQKLLTLDGAGDQFGYSVSASGDTVVVGSPSDNT